MSAAWRNWARDVDCRPARIERPGDPVEVAESIRRAGNDGLTVRVAGAGHSFAPLVATDGVLLSLDTLDSVLDVTRHDDGTASVRVQAGIRLNTLSEELDRRGLALPNLGDINVQSLAGAIATGTHGTGARLKPLHAQVEAIELVDGNGTPHELTEESDLRAARLALGALGVVTAVTLRCVPAFTLQGTDEPRDRDTTLDSLEELADGAEHFELHAFPHADKVLTRTNRRIEGPPRPPSKPIAFARDILLVNGALAAVCELGRARPKWIPALNRFATWAAGSEVRVDRSDRVFATPRLVKFTETEWSVPRAAAAAILRDVLDAATRHAVNLPMELRFGAADDTLLSPAYGRDTAYLSAHIYRGMTVEPFFDEVEAIGRHYDGRPHWGKRHGMTADELASNYPEWGVFQRLRNRLDPDRRFANVHLDRALGR